MANNKLYWIWIQQVLEYGNIKIKSILKIYGKIENFYNTSLDERKFLGIFSKKELMLMQSITLSDAEEIFEKCQKLGYDIITLEDARYPLRLKNISNPPCVLYVWGELPNIDNEICISIVGTRKATIFGCKSAFDIGFNLAKRGAIVVSGGALGIDSAAHKGAIQGLGKTIAVLGCGINCRYLLKNASLRHTISKNGCVISEFPPNHDPTTWTFPVRNRIISGLSLGVLVVEAGRKSGSLITANLSLDQNREVFVFEGNTNGALSCGTRALLKDGATPINTADDILKEYSYVYADSSTEVSKANKSESSPKKEHSKEMNLKGLSKNEKSVYNFILGKEKHIDEISMSLDLPADKVLSTLTVLELKGFVIPLPGRIYKAT